MGESAPACILCQGVETDKELERVQVWEDELWRLTTATEGELLGFSYLEPKRHVPHVEDLDGEEAATLGSALARCCRALKRATEAERVYVYVFGGGVPHLHLHLAPHREGDPLNAQMIKGEVVERRDPSGVTYLESKEYPPLPAEEHRAAIERIRAALA